MVRSANRRSRRPSGRGRFWCAVGAKAKFVAKTGAVRLRLNLLASSVYSDVESGFRRLTFPARWQRTIRKYRRFGVASLGNRRNPEIGNKGSARRRHRLRSLYADEGMRLIAVTGRPGHSDARKGPNISHEILGAQ